jgi:general secretion pathway protein J
VSARLSDNGAQAGVTLIETLVALFVIALMATAGAIMTSQTIRGARAVEMRGAAASEVSAALATLSADLAAYAGRASQDASVTEAATLFEGFAPRHDGRLLVFVRNGWPNPAGDARSDLQRVEYIFSGGALIRRSWASPDPGPATRSVDQILLDGIERIEMQFGRGDIWRSEWVTLLTDDDGTPQKAELTLVFSKDDMLTARYLIGGGR